MPPPADTIAMAELLAAGPVVLSVAVPPIAAVVIGALSALRDD